MAACLRLGFSGADLDGVGLQHDCQFVEHFAEMMKRIRIGRGKLWLSRRCLFEPQCRVEMLRSSARRSVMSSRSTMAKATGSAEVPSFRSVSLMSRWPIFVRRRLTSLTVPVEASRASRSSARKHFQLRALRLARWSAPSSRRAAAFRRCSEPSCPMKAAAAGSRSKACASFSSGNFACCITLGPAAITRSPARPSARA